MKAQQDTSRRTESLPAYWNAATAPLLVLMISVFFALNTYPVKDGDYFWHLATGHHIATHKSLPDSDPFTYTIEDANPFREESGRVEVILKQYWLGQLLIAGLWEIAGDAGIILTRATLYCGLALFLYFAMGPTHRGASGLLLTLLTSALLLEYPNERPALFSFPLLVLLLYLLESAKNRLPDIPRLHLLALPVTMLCWANMHGSYLLGNVVILIYAVGHALQASNFQRLLGSLPPSRWKLFQRQPLSPLFLVWLLLGIGASWFNPLGFQVAAEFFAIQPGYASVVQENISPLFSAEMLGEYFFPYWAFLGFTLFGLILNFKNLDFARLGVIIAITGLSLVSLRYMAFATFLAPLWIREISSRWFSGTAFAGLVAGVTVFVSHNLDFSESFRFRAHTQFPSEAVTFIHDNRPPQRLFNAYQWGGYLAWKLPEYPVFVDGRGLAEEIVDMENRVLFANQWREITDHYGINTILIPGVANYDGGILPLVEKLVRAPDWHLVHVDNIAMVWVRAGSTSDQWLKVHAKPKSAAWQHALARSDWLFTQNADPAGLWQTKGIALMNLGYRNKAREAFTQALGIDPELQQARTLLPSLDP